MTGVSVIQYYSTEIFASIGIDASVTLGLQSGNAVIALIGEGLCVLFIDRFGRRTPLITASEFYTRLIYSADSSLCRRRHLLDNFCHRIRHNRTLPCREQQWQRVESVRCNDMAGMFSSPISVRFCIDRPSTVQSRLLCCYRAPVMGYPSRDV